MKEGNQMNDKYYEQAAACVKDRVLPAQMELYRSCSGDLDRIYGEAMNGNGYFGKVIVPGHVYELGYEKCTCPKVLSGQITDPDHCNCSRQSILYILRQLEPESIFDVEMLETVLQGADHCRFRITKKRVFHHRRGRHRLREIHLLQHDEGRICRPCRLRLCDQL